MGLIFAFPTKYARLPIYMENLQDLKALLSFPKNVVIISHRNPDGDAIGSSLGLAHYLKQGLHSVKVIFPSEYPAFVAWMPGADDSIICDLEKDVAFSAIDNAEVIFCLDFNALDRIDPMEMKVSESKAPVVMIDHHMYPEGFADYVMSDTSASSTCEMVYQFMEMMGDANKANKEIGDCLFTGIVTDTGSFRYSVTPETFRVAGALQAAGADPVFIQDEIYNSMSEKNLRLLGHCLYNRMEIIDELETGIIWLTKQDFEDFDIQRGDTEGVVNFILKMKNVRIAAFIKEQQTIIKLSLRSKGDFSVQEIATKWFKGGGHKNASGGHFYGTVDACISRFKNAVRKSLASENGTR